ncbi:MAG: ATP-binding protein [Pseudomonadota bacterium]
MGRCQLQAINTPAVARAGGTKRGRLKGPGSLLIVLLVAAGLLGVVAWFAIGWAWRQAEIEARTSVEATADLLATGLEGVLAKFEPIAPLMAARPDVLSSFQAERDLGQADDANSLAATVQQATEADVVYFMRPNGDTFASSNWQDDDSFVGRNFSFRPYFQNAMRDGWGQYFALGTTSGQRGYYFAHRVDDGDEILGVVVVKVDLEAVEQAWQSLDDGVLVTDEYGVVFLTNRGDWRLRALSTLGESALQELAEDRRYGAIELTPLLISTVAATPGEQPHWLLASGEGQNADPVEFVSASRNMEDAGWTLHVLANLANERWGVVATAALALVSSALLLLAGLVIWQRRRRLIERIDFEQAAAEQLERQVASRTSELTETNKLLEQEIDERRRAEQELRRMQADLVQAGKLAALGQMSAALSHEFNQPLAAIRTYAENATLLLERRRWDEASENMQHIGDLTRRMAEISRNLNTFARRPDDRRVAVELNALAAKVMAFLADKKEKTGADVSLRSSSEELWVMAGEVRLELVVQNVLANALDAVAGSSRRQITIVVTKQVERAAIEIADTGVGIERATLQKIFDPFFTTKRTGEGLGLGLSIAYNIVKDFEGELSARNGTDGGAVFTISLPLADSMPQAAE